MKRIKLPKDVWVSLYGRLHDTIRHSNRIQELPLRDAFKDDDARDEVLNIMNFYFDKGFEVGLTKNTKVTIHE